MDESEWVPLRPDQGFVAQMLAASRARRGLACAGAVVDAAGLRAAWLDLPGGSEPGGAAFEAMFAAIRGGVGLGWRTLEGTVDLTGTSTTHLADRPERDWPAESHVGGFAYERFAAGRPQRAIYLLLALIAAVTVTLSLPAVQDRMRATDQNALVFSPAGARPLPGEQQPAGECGDGKVRCLNLCTILGWVASTVFALSFTRLGRA